MKTKLELLAELEQAQKRIAKLENTLASTKNVSKFPKDPVLKELHTSEKRFTALFRSNPIPVGFTRASDYRIVDVNDAWSILTGYSREEALGHTSTELGLAKPKTLQHVRDMLQDQGEIRQNEILLYTRAGQERHVLISSEPIEIDGEAYFLNNLLDVTEQRLAEQKLRESEEVFRAFIDQSHDGIMLSDEQGKIIEWNPALAQISGLERNQTLGMNAWDIQFQMMTPEKRSQITVEQLKTAMLNVMKEEHHPKFNAPGEFEIQTPQGVRKFLAQTSFPIFSPAGYRLGAIVRDITARKQADEKLRESEARFTTAFFTNPAPQSILSLVTGQVLEVNESTCRLFGYSREELIGIEPRALNLWAEPSEQLAALEELKTSGHLTPKLVTIRKKSGETRSIIFTAEQITWKAEPCLITSSLDITERKEAEQKVLVSEALLRQVLESSQDSIFAIDRDYRLLLNNKRHQRVLVETGGHAFEVGENVLPHDYPQEVLEFWRGLYDRAFNGEEFKWESEWTYTDGQQHVIEINFSPLRDAAGNITGALVVIRDITERKQSENMLARAHNTLEQAQKIAHMGSFEYIAATQTTVWSEEEHRIYGLDPSEPSPAYEEMLQKMIHPDDANLLHEVFSKAMQSNSVYELEHRIVQPDGSIRWVHDRAVPYLNQEGKLERYIGITLDITERRQTADALQQERALLRTLIDNLPDYVFLKDTQSRFMVANQATAELMGVASPNALLGKTDFDFYPMEEAQRYFDSEQRIIQSGESLVGLEYWQYDSVRNIRWLVGTKLALRDAQEQVIGLIGIERDITELKQTEEKFRTVADTIGEVFWIYDNQQGRIEYISQAYQTIWGRTPESLYENSKQYIEAILPEDRSLMFAALERQARGEKTEMEYRILNKDGNIRWIFDRSSPVFNEKGAVIRTTGIATDITERKQDEQRLVESEEKYRRLSEQLEERVLQATAEIRDLYENAPAGYHSLDEDGRFTQINQTELNWLGYPRNEVIGRPFADFVTDKGLSVFKENYPAFKQRGWLRDLEMEFMRKDGTTFLALVNATAVKDEAGNYVMSRSTVVDITDRKLAEQALRESEANLQNFLDTAHDLIQSLDEHGNFLYVNNAWCATLGYTLEEALHMNMFDVIAPEHHATCREMLKQLVVGEEPERVEVIFKTKQGQAVIVEGHVNSRKDANGQIATNGIFRDITARKQADEALKASETKYRQLFENMSEGFSLQEIITDENGEPVDFRYLDANSLFERHSGIAPQVVIGRTAREVFPQVDPRSIQNYGRVALTGEPIALEYFSSLINRHVSVRAFSTKHGQFATIFEDITERKQAEEKLNESYARLDFANRELERASRAKDEFLANMSHELRTPLNAIIGLSDSLLEISANDLTPKHQKYLNTIRESGQHLLNLINDVLDLAKVGAGQLVLEPRPVDINTVCQASLRMVKQLAANKNLDVHFDLDHNVDSINADERRLKQMLVNLLSNAVKFTPPAGTIGLEVRGDRTNKQVRFTVWDTGIGISKEDQAHLFQPFMQVNSSLVREVGGTGLGLVLVSEMARLHSGTVSLESEPGKGSRFSFTLPWYDQPTEVVSPQTTSSTGDLTVSTTSVSDTKHTILLVEDTETAAIVAHDYLEAKGYLVEVAKNGRDGIALAEKIKPDLILMDVQMPVMDGLEAMRRLRALAEFQNTPIIALTAYAMEEDRERCLVAGATDYVSKPYTLSLLVQKIEGLLKYKESGD